MWQETLRRKLAAAALAVLAIFGTLSNTAHAGVVASENFDYATGDFDDGFSGGTGWATGGWTDAGNVNSTRISSGRLQVTGVNNNNLATRNLASSLTSDFYFSFTLDVTQATINNNDFLTFWFNDSATYEADIPTIGLKGNLGTGGGDDDIMVRLTGTGGTFADFNLADSDGLIGIVGRLSKSISGGLYDTFDLWVQDDVTGFPTLWALGSPDTTAPIGGTISSVSTLGLRTDNLDGGVMMGDRFFIDNLQIATVPEPANLALWGFTGMVGLAYAWRTRRSALASCS